jgi:hypothetical protein
LWLALAGDHLDMAVLLIDHGATLPVAFLEEKGALKKAAKAGHLVLAAHLDRWGVKPDAHREKIWWAPQEWITAQPEFVLEWVRTHDTRLGSQAGSDAMEHVLQAWLSFFARHPDPDLLARVRTDCASGPDYQTHVPWERIIGRAWKKKVAEGNLNHLLSWAQQGLVPVNGAPDTTRENLLGSLLLTAMESGHPRIAHWLAADPVILNEARKLWPTEKAFSGIAGASPEVQASFLSLPFDWAATTIHGDTLAHAFFEALPEAKSRPGESVAMFEARELKARLDTLSLVFPPSILQQRNSVRLKPMEMCFAYNKTPWEERIATAMTVMESASLSRALTEAAVPSSLKKTFRL